MLTTIDKAGRVVVPVELRRRLGLRPGTAIEIQLDGGGIRLVKAVSSPAVGRVKGRLVARPQVAPEQRTEVDIAQLVEEERERWPK